MSETQNEYQLALTGQIAKWHEEAGRLANEARGGLAAALDAAANCGDAIQDWLAQNKGKGLAELRDILPHGQAKKYVMLAKVRKEHGALPTDMQVLRALPLFDPHHEDAADDDGATKQTRQDESAQFVRLCSRLLASITDAVSKRPPAKWSVAEREARAAQLKPLVDFYHNELGY